MLPPDPRAPSNQADATDSSEDKGGDDVKGNEQGWDGVDGDTTSTTTTSATTLETDNAGMYACMFETAVGMAAEISAQQIGIEGEEEGEQEGVDAGGGAEGRASSDDAEDHSDTES